MGKIGHIIAGGVGEMKRKITKTIGRRSCYTPISQSYLSSFIENLEPHSLSIPFLHVVCPFEAHKNILSHQTIPHSEVPYIVSDPQPLVQRPNLHPYQCVSIDKLRLLFHLEKEDHKVSFLSRQLISYGGRLSHQFHGFSWFLLPIFWTPPPQ